MKIEWRSLLATVAPVLATAAGGPLAGVATKAIAAKLLGNPDASQDQVEAAVLGADPAMLLKLRELDQQFQKDLQAAGIELEKIAAEDRASARNREVQVKDHMPAVIGVGVCLGFFAVLGWMLVNGKPPSGGDAMLVLLGSLGTAFTAIISYYYGSSAGSKLKTEALAKR